MTLVRLEYRLVDDRYHVITSPDMVGLHVTADSREAAEKEAVAVVSLIREKTHQTTVLKALEYAAT